MNWRVAALAPRHDRANFRCGMPALDEFLHKYATQNARKGLSRTFVATADGSEVVLGFYTLSSSSVTFDHAPEALQKKLPRYPVPLALLGKLAVDTAVKGSGLGQFLLIDAFHRVAKVSDDLGLAGVEVHAKDDNARRFYEKFGFIRFRDHANHLFLPLSTIRQVI